jgi:hydrogenase maturation factor
MRTDAGISSASRPVMPGGDPGMPGGDPGTPGGDCRDDHCITCGDVAEPMRVLRIDRERELALCADERGDRHTVEIALVQPVAVDDELLVHAGTAIAALESTPAAVLR